MTRRTRHRDQPPSLAGYRQVYAFDLRSDCEIEAWLARLRGGPTAGSVPAAAPAARSGEDAPAERDAEPAAGA